MAKLTEMEYTAIKQLLGKGYEGIKVATRSMEQYLLEEKNMLTEPEHIFIHMETEKVYFVYFPYYIEETASVELYGSRKGRVEIIPEKKLTKDGKKRIEKKQDI